jgi:MFS family permease
VTRTRSPLAGVVGALVVVEATSGVLQGYYVPLLTDVARHLGIPDADVNWFEAAQLLVSAIVVPLLARLGDMVGHKKVLVGSLVVTAAASWAVAFAGTFWLFTLVWALQGFYVVWLPMNVSIIHARARRYPNSADLTRRGAGLITVALEAGAILGALTAGQLGVVLAGRLSVALAVPAVMVTVALLVVLWKVEDPGVTRDGRVDTGGTVLLSIALLAITGGLALVRVNGVTWWVVVSVLGGLGLMAVFVWFERRSADPVVDMRLIGRSSIWPVVLTSTLLGVSLLGAQGALSTFAGTDPTQVGYGLGLDSASRSYVIGGYVLSLLVGAVIFAALSTVVPARSALTGAAALIAAGYVLMVPFHGGVASVVSLMVVAGLGSGALVAALPAAAAAAAPPHQTGMATGLTNTSKTLGGALASAVFALALGSGMVQTTTAAPLSGYLTVWAICGAAAVVAVVVLLTVPAMAFGSATPVAVGADD